MHYAYYHDFSFKVLIISFFPPILRKILKFFMHKNREESSTDFIQGIANRTNPTGLKTCFCL